MRIKQEKKIILCLVVKRKEINKFKKKIVNSFVFFIN